MGKNRRNKNPHRVVGGLKAFAERGRQAQAAVDEIVVAYKDRKCRVCGCTNDDCLHCIQKTGERCIWVEDDLCSACVDVSEADIQAALEQAERDGLVERRGDDDDPYDVDFLEETSPAAAEFNVELHNRRKNWDREHRKDEPVLTIAVATEAEKRTLEAKIRDAGGAESNIAHAVVAMPPEMLAIMTHWVHMGQVPQMFVKITPDQRSIRIVALRLSPEVASRL